MSSARLSNSPNNKRLTAESEIIQEGIASEESINISQISAEEKQRDLEALKISDKKLHALAAKDYSEDQKAKKKRITGEDKFIK